MGFFLIRPSDAAVRDAVWTLVPPDAAAIETKAGGSDYSPFTIPYHAHVEFDLEQTNMDERVELVRRRAEDSGWQLVSQGTFLAAQILNFQKSGLEGRAHVRPYPSIASVERDQSFARLAIGGGAAVGAVIGATAAVVARRRSS